MLSFKAALTVIGFIVEPGSNISVTTLLRTYSVSRDDAFGLGLKEG